MLLLAGCFGFTTVDVPDPEPAGPTVARVPLPESLAGMRQHAHQGATKGAQDRTRGSRPLDDADLVPFEQLHALGDIVGAEDPDDRGDDHPLRYREGFAGVRRRGFLE